MKKTILTSVDFFIASSKQLLATASICTFILITAYSCEKASPLPDEPNELNECVTYEAKSFSGSKSGTWSVANEVDNYPGLLPAVTDPAGGYYIVTLTSEVSTPWIDISIPGDPYPIINGSNGLTISSPNANFRKVAFLAYPGVSYDVFVNPFQNSPNFPENYTISWEYVGIMDCYENNDEFNKAKFVPKNITLDAYANAGYKNVGPAHNRFDWYKVTVNQTSKLRVDIMQSPNDEFMNVKLFRQDNSQLTATRTDVSGNSGAAQPGTLYSVTSNNTLQPGTYYISIEAYNAADNRKYDINNGETMPDAWTKPYKFRVTTVQ